MSVAALLERWGELPVLPTSPAQERFWVLDQLESGLAAYTIPAALRLRGPLDAPALHGAIAELVARHESLRTVFALDVDGPMQVILPTVDVPLPVTDLRPFPAAERGERLEADLAAAADAPFDLATGPLLRTALFNTGDDEHVLLLVLHHAIADGWSLGVFFRELSTAYAALHRGDSPAFAPLPLQYGDVAVWQRRSANGEGIARQLDYWARQLDGVQPLALPTDRPRGAEWRATGGKRQVVLPAAIGTAVRAAAAGAGSTPYVFYLAAFAALLHRYSGQPDFAIGSIVSGRQRPEVEPLIGLFVNTLAIRTRVDAAASFESLVAGVREAVAGALDHQDVPFEQVVDRVEPHRERGRSPIFQVAFQLLDGLSAPPRFDGVAVEPVAIAKSTAKFDLTLVVRPDRDGDVTVVAEYADAILDAGTVDRLLAHYGVLVEAAARDPQRPVGRLPLLSPTARSELLAGSAESAVAYPAGSAAELVRAAAASSPQARAVTAEDATLTYTQLLDRSAAIAAALRARGVHPGGRVAVCASRRADLVAALLAVWRAGAAYVPLDPAYPADRISYVLDDCGADALIVDANTPRLDDVRAPVLHLDEQLPRPDGADAAIDAPLEPESPAYVIYTSGSTGQPKGVVVPHRALANFLRSMAERPGLTAADAVVAVTTISFDIAGLELWLPLTVGAEVVLASRDTAVDGTALRGLVERTASRIAGHVLLQATPATWRLLLDAGWTGTPTLVMLCGGEAWPAGLAAQLRDRGAELWNVYGPTETTIWSTRARITGDDVPLGEPLANTVLHVLEPSGEPAPLGVPGELWIGGAGLALGYHGRPELTAERFVEHAEFGRLYRTGDLVRGTTDGQLVYLGRLDDQVKVRGHRIELGEVEAVLAAAPEVVQAAAAVRGTAGDARLVGYVVLTAFGAAAEAQVLAGAVERMRSMLPDYMVPSALVRLDSLPLTANGKVDRRALPEPATNAQVASRPYVAPRSPLEQQIADAWAAVLGVERVGADDDFLELGGHSLPAMRVIARLSGELPVRLSIGALFQARTVTGLAELVVRQLAEREAVSASSNELAGLLAELDALSDAEAAAMLAGLDARDGGVR